MKTNKATQQLLLLAVLLALAPLLYLYPSLLWQIPLVFGILFLLIIACIFTVEYTEIRAERARSRRISRHLRVLSSELYSTQESAEGFCTALMEREHSRLFHASYRLDSQIDGDTLSAQCIYYLDRACGEVEVISYVHRASHIGAAELDELHATLGQICSAQQAIARHVIGVDHIVYRADDEPFYLLYPTRTWRARWKDIRTKLSFIKGY